MSDRKAKKAKQREAKLVEKAVGERKATSVLRRRRVTLIALAAGLTLLGVSIFNGSREARLTILNRAGVTLKGIKIEFPGGVKSVEALDAGGTLSIPLEADGSVQADWPKGLVAIELHRDNDAPLRFRSFAARDNAKLHQVFTATSLPDGRLNLTPLPDEGQGPRFSFRALLRSMGIGR